MVPFVPEFASEETFLVSILSHGKSYDFPRNYLINPDFPMLRVTLTEAKALTSLNRACFESQLYRDPKKCTYVKAAIVAQADVSGLVSNWTNAHLGQWKPGPFGFSLLEFGPPESHTQVFTDKNAINQMVLVCSTERVDERSTSTCWGIAPLSNTNNLYLMFDESQLSQIENTANNLRGIIRSFERKDV